MAVTDDDIHVRLVPTGETQVSADGKWAVSIPRSDMTDPIELARRLRDRCADEFLIESADITGACDAIEHLTAERDEAARLAKHQTERLLNLLARIHRDGGHHTAAVGLAGSLEDADLAVATAYAERDEARRERDEFHKRWRSCHALICVLGKHHGCGGTVSVVDSGVGALQCDKCGVQDWNEGRDYDENLLDKIEDERWLRTQLSAIKAALNESLNRWEWFAQRFRDRIGGLAAADEHDFPRIAELRKMGEEA